MKNLKKTSLPQLLETLNTGASVYVPVSQNGVTRFAVWEKDQEITLAGKNTTIPPKEIFFPQTEEIYKYQSHKLQTSIEEIAAAVEPVVILGVRPCDVKGIEVLDDVFLTKGYEDSFYKEKRENSVLISLGCNQPETTCFCSSMGIDSMRAPGADVMMWDLGDTYGFEPQTEAGKNLLESLANLLTEENAQVPAAQACTLQVEMEGLTEKLQPMFENPLWEEISRKCINCGTCTYLCPTCHCFDIQGKTRGEAGVKFRCYDSCMYKDYTLMAGGHNPRPGKKERVRQRFLHKLQYIPERYQKLGCVGCGRCIVKCPVNLDITRVINQVREVSLDA